MSDDLERLRKAVGKQADDDLRELLYSSKIRFGLRAQGHIPTIEMMLAEGASWDDIGRAIGWCPDTAREWYERDVAPRDTTTEETP